MGWMPKERVDGGGGGVAAGDDSQWLNGTDDDDDALGGDVFVRAAAVGIYCCTQDALRLSDEEGKKTEEQAIRIAVKTSRGV